MKAQVYDRIKTLVELHLASSDVTIPKGAIGAIIECYENPEVYAVDLAIPDFNFAGFAYHQAILTPEKFEVLRKFSDKDDAFDRQFEAHPIFLERVKRSRASFRKRKSITIEEVKADMYGLGFVPQPNLQKLQRL